MHPYGLGESSTYCFRVDAIAGEEEPAGEKDRGKCLDELLLFFRRHLQGHAHLQEYCAKFESWIPYRLFFTTP